MSKFFLGHAVVDGNIRFLSVSAIEKFDASTFGGCERKWWFRYIDGKKEPESEAMKRGTALAAELAHYLKTGEDVLSPITRAGKHLLPVPGADLEIEEPLGDVEKALAMRDERLRLKDSGLDGEIARAAGLSAAGIPLIGAADFRHRRGEYVDADGVVRREAVRAVEVGDHKSTARIFDIVEEATGIVQEKGYAKTTAQISDAIQMVGYAVHASGRYSDATHVRLSHIYYQTRDRKCADKRTVLVTADEAMKKWERVEGVVRRMTDVAREKTFESVSPNYQSCSAYRGCAYQTFCPKSPQQLVVDLLGGGKAMSLFKNTQKPNLTLIPQTNGTVAEDPARRAQIDAEKARLASEAAGVCACGVKLSVENSSKLPSGTLIHIGCPKRAAAAESILPPDAAKSTPASAAVPVPPETLAAMAPGLVKDAAAAQAKLVVETASAVPKDTSKCPQSGVRLTLATDVAIARKMKCGSCGKDLKLRPVKEGDVWMASLPRHDLVTVAAPAPVAVAAPAEVSTPATAPDQTPTAIPVPTATFAPTPAIDFILFVDVVASGRLTENGHAPIDLETYYLPIVRELERSCGAADIRCAPKDSALGFGQWKGALASAIRAVPPTPGTYVLRGVMESEVKAVVVEALQPMAGLYVRGVR